MPTHSGVAGGRTINGLVDDAVLLLLTVLLFPFVILAAGVPLALLAWVLREIVERVF